MTQAHNTIKSTLSAAAKVALKEKQKDRLTLVRMALAAIKQVEVDERIEVTDERALVILDKMVKQRKDAASQFKDAGRTDLVDKEIQEIKELQTFLPTALSTDEIQTLISQAMAETGAQGMKDMGKVMGILKPKLQGRADLGQVSAQIKAQLNTG